MKNPYSISIVLDKRRPKKDGTYPVKLRVFTATPRKQVLYSTKFDYTEKEYQSIWLTTKPRNEYKAARQELQALELRASDIAKEITPFTFEQFEKRLFRKAGSGVYVSYQYQEKIDGLKKRKQLNTADLYELSRKSVSRFLEAKSKKRIDQLTFFDLTVDWLKDYEAYMVEDEKKSLTTVSIYLRQLRAVYEMAIQDKEIERELSPFGAKKYQIPTPKGTKRALSQSQLSRLFHSEPETAEQQKAKDFWFFSYMCNGMNTKDIAQLRYKNINGDKIEFYRAKTLTTSRTNMKLITVFMNSFIKEIIEKYGNPEREPEQLIFDIAPDELSPNERRNKIKAFTRYINQHLKKLSIANDITAEISTYWARHSFATNSIRKGFNMEFMQESLGHSNIKTTQNYFAGFDDESKKQFAEQLMDF